MGASTLPTAHPSRQRFAPPQDEVVLVDNPRALTLFMGNGP